MHELERSLRDTLSDERWALPTWTDPEQRLRARARARRRRRAAVVTVGMVALVTAIVVPVSRAGRGGRGTDRLTAVGPSATAAPTGAPKTLPAPGVQFPEAGYPPPVPIAAGSMQNVVSECPNPAGLQPIGTVHRSAVISALTLLTRGTSTPLEDELLGLDRTEWAQFAAGYSDQGPAGTIHLLYAGPLLAEGPATFGPPDLAGTITAACGAGTAGHSLVAIEGPPAGPALQEEYLFVRRGGRLLAYATYP